MPHSNRRNRVRLPRRSRDRGWHPVRNHSHSRQLYWERTECRKRFYSIDTIAPHPEPDSCQIQGRRRSRRGGHENPRTAGGRFSAWSRNRLRAQSLGMQTDCYRGIESYETAEPPSCDAASDAAFVTKFLLKASLNEPSFIVRTAPDAMPPIRPPARPAVKIDRMKQARSRSAWIFPLMCSNTAT